MLAQVVNAGAKKRNLLPHDGFLFVPGARAMAMIVKDKKCSSPNVRFVLVTVLIWFFGYITTGAKVSRIWEKTVVKFECIFQPAPETVVGCEVEDHGRTETENCRSLMLQVISIFPARDAAINNPPQFQT